MVPPPCTKKGQWVDNLFYWKGNKSSELFFLENWFVTEKRDLFFFCNSINLFLPIINKTVFFSKLCQNANKYTPLFVWVPLTMCGFLKKKGLQKNFPKTISKSIFFVPFLFASLISEEFVCCFVFALWTTKTCLLTLLSIFPKWHLLNFYRFITFLYTIE